MLPWPQETPNLDPGPLPRFSSLDALYNASILLDKRPRTASHGSEKDDGLQFEDGFFYDEGGNFFDESAPAV